MADSKDEVVLFGCGDVGPMHEPIDQYGVHVEAMLATGDIRFAQCERIYSDRGALQVHSGGHLTRMPPKMAEVFPSCGFNVVSMASNHAMDWGAEAMLDTIALMDEMGIATAGAGHNIEEARRPAIFDVRGTKVALLGYCSVLRGGYAAGPDSPGIAPMRAHTYYEPIEFQAGTPPRVITVPDADDLWALCADIDAARQIADSVVVSIHWGIHHIPKVIADYQRIVARAAFAHGVDLLLGSHAHLPKAIEVFDGRACFYSLGNFMYTSVYRPGHSGEKYGIAVDSQVPNYPFAYDARNTVLAKATIGKGGVTRTSFLPTFIDDEARPELLAAADPRFADLLSFMEEASEGFDHHFAVDGNEIVVS